MNIDIKTMAVILAAGKGTRMQNTLPKVIHPLNYIPMIHYVLEHSYLSGIKNFTVIVGYEREQVMSCVKDWQAQHSDVYLSFCIQEEQKGTGHAVQVAKNLLTDEYQYINILTGDTPLIYSDTLKKAYNTILSNNNISCLVLTTIVENPTGYGRIIRNEDNNIIQICEEKDATDDQKKIDEINTGIFIFNREDLLLHIDSLKTDNIQREYYLPDLVEKFIKNKLQVIPMVCLDSNQFIGINSREQLLKAEKILTLCN